MGLRQSILRLSHTQTTPTHTTMCKQSVCQNEGCGKRTWWGCGQHIDSVMSQIPENEQCKCANHNAANPMLASVQSMFGGGAKTKQSSPSCSCLLPFARA